VESAGRYECRSVQSAHEYIMYLDTDAYTSVLYGLAVNTGSKALHNFLFCFFVFCFLFSIINLFFGWFFFKIRLKNLM